MSKINVLVAPGDRSGSGKFRCIDPHVNLQNNFSNDFFIDINFEVDFNDVSYLKKYDIIFIHRVPQHKYPEAVTIIKRIKSLGIKVIVDTDDYWHLDPSHGMYQSAVRAGIPAIILECIKLADMVTVPTQILADKVKPFNKHVFVLPNAIDPKEDQFKPKIVESDFTRFGWVGGSSHVNDLELLEDIGAMHSTIKDKAQLVLCGFDTRGTFKYINPETGKQEERPMRPEETIWFTYECFLTNNYRNLENDPTYLKYLITFKEKVDYDDSNKIYRRIWTKPINKYALAYNNFDVALAPLDNTVFNLYKSQLKVLEAGFHKKAIIAQNYGPYTIDLISAINKGGELNSKGNSLLIDIKKNHKQWFKYIKKLTTNPEMVKDLGEKLYETVKDKYDLNNVTKARAELYNILINP